MTYMTAFTYGPFVVYVLTMALFVARQRFAVRTQAIWAMVLLAAFAKFLCFAEFGGHAFSPDFPEAVIWAWDFLYSGAMILFALSLVCLFRFRGKAWVLPVVAWGLSAWGLYEGVRVPSVREMELRPANLPPSLEGYRIVHLSDLHCSMAARRWRTAAVVERANAVGADLICLTGDFADGKVAKVGPYLEPLKELRAKDGVYACTGNHEYYHGYLAWKALFYDQAPNIRFLTNECVFPHAGMALAGVPEGTGWSRGRTDALPDVRGAFAAATNGEFRVLLQHRPKTAAINVREVGVRLQLSGHTHGGIAPLFRRVIATFNGGFVHGLYSFGDSFLYVNSGCGQWAGFPMRILNPSEITLITLRR